MVTAVKICMHVSCPHQNLGQRGTGTCGFGRRHVAFVKLHREIGCKSCLFPHGLVHTYAGTFV